MIFNKQYLAGLCYQRDTPIVAALCPILLFVEYHDDGIFLHCCRPPPLQIQTTMISSRFYRRRDHHSLSVTLNQLDGDFARSDSL